MQSSKKKLTPSEAKLRIYRYCSYQERSHHEVRDKLYSFGLFKAEVEDLISELITDGFLNEERFAKAFAGGKFRMQRWGRIKITHEMEAKGLTPNCIRSGLKEIDETTYREVLLDLLEKKHSSVTGPNEFVRKDKTAKYAIQKGFEPELVWSILKQFSVK